MAKEIISITIDKPLIEKIANFLKGSDMSRSRLVRQAVSEFIENEGKERDAFQRLISKSAKLEN